MNGPGQKVAQVDKLAVSLIFDVDDAVARLAAADGLAVYDDVRLGANHGEGDLSGRKKRTKAVE